MTHELPLASEAPTRSAEGHDYEACPPIGVDLGTTNSAMAYWINSRRRQHAKAYVLNEAGDDRRNKLSMSSAVYRDHNGHLLSGLIAAKRKILEPERVAIAVKNRMGTTEAVFQLGSQAYTPTELSAGILEGLFAEGTAVGLRDPVSIVVGVPYYFLHHQNHQTRIATQQAVETSFPAPQAKRDVSLLPEPIAAALDYIFRHLDQPLNETAMIFDMGGGTLDLTLLKLRLTASHVDIEVLGCEGDAQFGGEFFDQILVDHFMETLNLPTQDLSDRELKHLQQHLKDAAVEAKEDLSINPRTTILLHNLPHKPFEEITLKRSEFEAMLLGNNPMGRDYAALLGELITRNLDKAGIKAAAVKRIILIGGSTKIPLFRNQLQQTLDKATFVENPNSTYTAVARGAAIYAAYLTDQRLGSQHLPKNRTIRFVTRSSHALGVETHSGLCNILVPENAILPYSVSQTFLPVAYQDQTRNLVKLPQIRILQGSDLRAANNTPIGHIRLPDIYAHGRELHDIAIFVRFQLETTMLTVDIDIPQGQKSGADIHLCQEISLEEDLRS